MFKKWLDEFKKFALKGNVLDMAVGVIVGGAFTAIVSCLTDDILKPLINLLLNLITGKPTESFSVTGAASALLSAVIQFFLTALVLFLLVKGINQLMKMGKKPEAPKAPTTKKCPYCKSEIDITATRCPHCTSELPEIKQK